MISCLSCMLRDDEILPDEQRQTDLDHAWSGKHDYVLRQGLIAAESRELWDSAQAAQLLSEAAALLDLRDGQHVRWDQHHTIDLRSNLAAQVFFLPRNVNQVPKCERFGIGNNSTFT
jgi:hypothetical protein